MKLFLNPVPKIKTRLYLSLLLVVFVCMNGGWAQQYPARNYNMDDGLSHSNVYRLFQDQRGFIWFCTDYGLCSFDGKSFNTINNDSLLGGSVMSISEDKKGNKLISTLKEGIIVLTDSSLKKYPITERQPQALYAIAKNNKIWVIARESGHALCEVTGNTIKKSNIRDHKGNFLFFNKIIADDVELLFPTNEGLYRVRDTVITPFLRDKVQGEAVDVKKGRNGTYWVALKNKIVEVRKDGAVHSYHLKPGQVVGNILYDRLDNLWISLDNGDMLLLHHGIVEDISDRLAIKRTFINDMMEDKEGNIWLATYDAGVYKISTLDVLNYPLQKNQLNIFCNSLQQLDKNKILIGTIGNVIIWENGKISPVPFNAVNNNEFVYFARSFKDLIYIGTPHGLFSKKSRSPGSKILGPLNKEVGAISICIDHNEKIWIGGFAQLYHLEGNKIVLDNVADILKGKRFNAIMEDSKHNLWLGTSTGLIKYDGRQYSLFPLPERKKLKAIRAIREDSHHRIWAATEGGLICIENDSCKIFTTKHGLTHNKCNTLIEDQNNTMWVGTLRGLSYIDLNTLEIKRYGVGIYPAEVLSMCYNADNILFVGTATGLSSIKTNRVFVDKTPPPLYITSIKTSSAQINMPESIELPYHDNKLRIDFVGLSFQNANAIEYRYRIKGLDKAWYFTDNTSIELPSLPSGNYTFALATRKNAGNWSKEITLPITVSTPFWRTWWFMSGILAILILSIIKIVRTRQGIIHRKKTEALLKEMNEKLEQRAKELAASNSELEQFAYIASHDMQEPLRMVTSFLTQLENKYKDQLDETAKKYIHFATDGAVRMRRIILDLLEYSRVGRQAGGKTEVNCNELLLEAVQLNRVVIEEKNALVNWKNLPLVKGNKTALQQVFQNLIGNAIKYQKPGQSPVVEIKAIEMPSHWQFTVSDNGIGIEARYFDKIFVVFQRLHTKEEYSGTGIGLAICKKIIENHHGTIWVESEHGSGSAFYFTISKNA